MHSPLPIASPTDPPRKPFSKDSTSVRKLIVKTAIAFFGVNICFLVYAYLHEVISYTYFAPDMARFHFPLVLISVQGIANVIVSAIGLKFTSTDRRLSLLSLPLKSFAIPAIPYCMATFATNMALKYISFPTQVVIKSCKPLVVLVFSVVLKRSRVDKQKIFAVLFIVCGLCVYLLEQQRMKTQQRRQEQQIPNPPPPLPPAANDGDDEEGREEKLLSKNLDELDEKLSETPKKDKKKKSDSSSSDSFLIGFVLLSVALFLDGLNGVAQDHVRKLKLSSMATMFCVNVWASVFLVVMCVGSGEIRSCSAC